MSRHIGEQVTARGDKIGMTSARVHGAGLAEVGVCRKAVLSNDQRFAWNVHMEPHPAKGT